MPLGPRSEACDGRVNQLSVCPHRLSLPLPPSVTVSDKTSPIVDLGLTGNREDLGEGNSKDDQNTLVGNSQRTDKGFKNYSKDKQKIPRELAQDRAPF